MFLPSNQELEEHSRQGFEFWSDHLQLSRPEKFSYMSSHEWSNCYKICV